MAKVECQTGFFTHRLERRVAAENVSKQNLKTWHGAGPREVNSHVEEGGSVCERVLGLRQRSHNRGESATQRARRVPARERERERKANRGEDEIRQEMVLGASGASSRSSRRSEPTSRPNKLAHNQFDS